MVHFLLKKGGHVRHSVDHINKVIQRMSASPGENSTILYDQRMRNTDIETSPEAALRMMRAMVKIFIA
jgi:hypothetical protein